MYRVSTGVHVQLAHHIRGHAGPCISLHGHTWRFALTLEASSLDPAGFVIDFDEVHQLILQPCHQLLDHALAMGEQTYQENREHFAALGENLVATRMETVGSLGETQPVLEGALAGARNALPGGIKVAIFPFAPTSERLAKWFFDAATEQVADARVRVARTQICETLHPVENTAEYRPPRN